MSSLIVDNQLLVYIVHIRLKLRIVVINLLSVFKAAVELFDHSLHLWQYISPLRIHV